MKGNRSPLKLALALNQQLITCVEIMGRLSRKQVRGCDPEPVELAELRNAAKTLPDMTEDPFIGTSLAELSPYGTSWHRTMWDRAKDWSARLSEAVVDLQKGGRSRVMGMPALDAAPQILQNYLLVEMNRVRERWRSGTSRDQKRVATVPNSQRKKSKPQSGKIARPVELLGRGQPPVVRGKRKERPLTSPQYDVVGILLTAGEKGLAKDDLVEKSNHADARGILRRLAENDPDWRDVIQFPGKPHGRYRIG